MVRNQWIFTTGGQGGIGQGILAALKKSGYQLIDCSLEKNPAGMLQDLYFSADLTQEAEIKRIFTQLEEQKIQISGLVHCAGSAGKTVGLPFIRIDPEDFDRCFALHNKAFFYLMKYALALFHPDGASVVGLSSIAALKNGESVMPYAASKAALNVMVQCFARELAQKKIRVNAVAPGFVWTPLWDSLAGEYLLGSKSDEARKGLFRKVAEMRTLMHEPQTPEELGALVAFLMADDSRSVTGQIFYSDGGASVM